MLPCDIRTTAINIKESEPHYTYPITPKKTTKTKHALLSTITAANKERGIPGRCLTDV